MKLWFNSNPSRGWHWWSLGKTPDAPLVNGPVCHSIEQVERDVATLALRLGIAIEDRLAA